MCLASFAPQAAAQQDAERAARADEEALRLMERAVQHEGRGEFEQAAPLVERALTLVEAEMGAEHPAFSIVLDNLHLLARTFDKRGQFDRAETLYARVLSAREKLSGADSADAAAVANELANVYISKGDHARAESLLLRALAAREKLFGPAHPLVANLLNNLGGVHHSRRDYARAEQFYRRSLAAASAALPPDSPQLADVLNNLGTLLRARGRPAEARAHLTGALAIREKAFGREGAPVAVTLNNVALLEWGAGRRALAVRLVERALAIIRKRQGPRHPEAASALFNLAALNAALGRRARALTHLAEAGDIREHNLSAILEGGSEEQKRLYLATLADETDYTVWFHLRAGGRGGAAARDESAARLAFLTLLRRKGRVLDAWSDQLGALRRRAAPADRALFDRLAGVRSRLAALALRSSGEEGGEEAARLAEEEQRIEAAASAQSREFEARTRRVTIESVRAALPADSALVEFTLYRPFDERAASPERKFGPPRYAAYVLTADGALRWAELGSAARVDEAVARLRAALARPTSLEEARRAARALDALAFLPVRRLAGGARQLLLSPDGALNLVPFAALVDESGRHAVERFSLTYLTGGRDLLRLQTGARARGPAVVVADPLFDKAEDDAGKIGGGASENDKNEDRTPPPVAVRGDDATARQQPSALSRVKFAPLKGTREEARLLGELLRGAEVLTGERATERAVKSLSAPEVLHVATHGFFLGGQSPARSARANDAARPTRDAADSVMPLARSGLALAGANRGGGGAGEDGILTALEASALDLWGTKLVVLSACETGVGEVRAGDGVYGLRRALVLAGSESQLMSLWQVSDEATRDFMVAYYKRLRAGDGRTEALRRVQLDMFKAGGQTAADRRRGLLDQIESKADRSHPYFWAAFIQSGDWRPMGAGLDGAVTARQRAAASLLPGF